MSHILSQSSIILGPGSRTRRKMSGTERQQALSKGRCKEIIQEMLISTGQRDLLKRLIQSRCAQSGWSYAMRNKYIEYIKQRGPENVNVSHMVSETVSSGVEMFPDAIKTEIGDILWDFASEYIGIDDSAQPSLETENSNFHSELFQYQNKDAKPDPGLGFNVATPQRALSRTPSPCPDNVPRPLTPQPPIPILIPEMDDDDIKDEPLSGPEDDDEDGLSSDLEDNNHDDDEDEDDEEEMDEDEVNMNHNNEESEEELMDV